MSEDSANSVIFISYAREDYKEARRLYEELKTVGLNPWLDKENILPGYDFTIAIRRAIEKSRFFVPLFSSYSVEKRGYIQKEFRYALDYADRFPPDDVFIIPVKLDECDIPHERLRSIHHVEMFPDWNNGFSKILQTIGLNAGTLQQQPNNKEKLSLVTQNQDTCSSSSTTLTAQEIKSSQRRIPLFRGEKSGFLGRQEYIDKEIRDYFKTPGTVISIIGPGGSGKSQLAFKAIRQYYEKESIFDIVIPVYFDINLMTFEEFLFKIAEKILPSSIELNKFEKTTMDERKNIIRNVLCDKKHPLIFIDNFETASLLVNEAEPHFTRCRR